MFHQIVTSDNPQPVDGSLRHEAYVEPTSPDAAKSRQIAQETWRRQAEDVLKRQQEITQENQNIQPNVPGEASAHVPKAYSRQHQLPRQQPTMPPFNPYFGNMYFPQDFAYRGPQAGRDGAQSLSNDITKLKRQVAEMRKYFKYWVRKEASIRNRMAVKIQSIVRSYLSRRKEYATSPTYRSLHTKRYCGINKGVQSTKLVEFKRLYPTIDLLILPNTWNDSLYRKATQMASSGASEHDHSARWIQKCFRGYRVRKMLALINLQNEAITKLQSRWRGYLARRPIKDGTSKKYQSGSDGMTLISSTQLANLYSTVNQLRQENKLQQQRSDAQEKALRILWEEVRKIKERGGKN